MDNLKCALRQSRLYWLVLIVMALVALLPDPARIGAPPHSPQAAYPGQPDAPAKMEKMQ